jgi:hypothetical protein
LLDQGSKRKLEISLRSVDFLSVFERKINRAEPAERLLSSLFLTMPAIGRVFAADVVAETLAILQPRIEGAKGCSTAEQVRALLSGNFGDSLQVLLAMTLSPEEFRSAEPLFRTPGFLGAARLNSGRFERICDHVRAFCQAIKAPHGQSERVIAQECVKSLAQELNQYRDNFIVWSFPFSRGVPELLARSKAEATTIPAEERGASSQQTWMTRVFNEGFVPPDPRGVRLNLCLDDPRFLVLGAMLREKSCNLLSIVSDIVCRPPVSVRTVELSRSLGASKPKPAPEPPSVSAIIEESPQQQTAFSFQSFFDNS